MKINFYINGKKTTRNAVKKQVGEERLKRMIAESKERKIHTSKTITSSAASEC